VVIVLGLLGVAAGLVVFAAMAFVASSPPTVDFASDHQSGKPIDIEVQTVGAIGFGPHPSWVSYLVRNPQGQWVHTTLWSLPQHTRVNVTLLQYDSGSPLRNQQLGRVTGTIGGTETLNGRRVKVVDSYSLGVGHTFSVPTIGLNVPLPGVPTNAKNPCSAAPCHIGEAHNVVKFSFVTPGAGEYRWQCFVPCGGGFLYGNGGPMQTVGYMDGFLDVVS
jgi:hypothetical protein